jgi:hypothetical protein
MRAGLTLVSMHIYLRGRVLDCRMSGVWAEVTLSNMQGRLELVARHLELWGWPGRLWSDRRVELGKDQICGPGQS